MLQNFFRGRYGIDNLSVGLLLLAALLSNIRYMWIVGALLIGLAIYRTFSKDTAKRISELKKFNLYADKIWRYLQPLFITLSRLLQSAYRKLKAFITRLQQSKYYSFTRCPECRNMLRLPKNKGKLLVTCPVCKHEFTKKV